MIWSLPRPNPPPPCCCHRPQKFPAPLVEGSVVTADNDFVDIAIEDIVVVEILLAHIDQADTQDVLVQRASSHHLSSSRYPSFSLAAAEMLCNLSRCVLQTYKIYNTD